MALSNETSAWLNDLKAQGNLDDATFNALKASLEGNDKADGFVKDSVHRQADYSRAMAATQAAQEELRKREAALTNYQAELGTWKEGADKTFQQAIKDREDATRKLNNTLSRLRTTAVAAGMSEEEVLKDLDAPPVVKEKESVDTSHFVTRDQIMQTVQESALIDAAIYDIATEYHELTGAPLRDAAKLVGEAIAAKKPLSQYVAEKFNFSKLRNDRAEAGIQTRINEAVAAERAKILSDATLGNPRGTGRDDLKGSPILGTELKAPQPGAQPGGGISAAVAAFQQGLYKGGVRH